MNWRLKFRESKKLKISTKNRNNLSNNTIGLSKILNVIFSIIKAKTKVSKWKNSRKGNSQKGSQEKMITIIKKDNNLKGPIV